MRQITKGLTLGTLLLSTQLLSPLAMLASAELPGRVKVQPCRAPLPEEAFQSLLVSKLMGRLGYEVQPAQEGGLQRGLRLPVAQGTAPSSPSTGYRCRTTSMSRRGTRCSSRQGTPCGRRRPGATSSTRKPRPGTGITNLGQLRRSQAGGAV